jgi:segregation and condensation protein B
MSLRAKLEAVIYAAEEPVTLAQLAQIFASDALEWKASQSATAAEMNADVAGESPAGVDDEGRLLLDPEMASLGVADTVAMSVKASEPIGEQVTENPAASQDGGETQPQAPDSEAGSPIPEAETPSAQAEEAPGQPELDPEAEARRLARQREREIKSILKQILDELIANYGADDRGIEIKEIAGGYRMATKPECHDAVRIFVKSLKPPLKLSLPALETLAVVAYKQPATAPEVSEIRGVESGGVLGSLLARKLIATAGRKQVIGRPILYKTTKEFLLRFGLKDLSELPSMEEFEKMAAEIEEMEPEVVAADAAEDAAESSGEVDENSPSGGEPGEPAEPSRAQASEANSDTEAAPAETPTDETSAEITPPSHEHDAAEAAASVAPPAAPESPAPAENEAVPHAEKVQEDH